MAKSASLELLELNFERNPEFSRLFSASTPRTIYDDILLQLGRRVPPQNALLFLDEIQSAPELLAKLRWFAEEMSELPVIAAGSLLEFALNENPHSMPVGRSAVLALADTWLLSKSRSQGVLGDWNPSCNDVDMTT